MMYFNNTVVKKCGKGEDLFVKILVFLQEKAARATKATRSKEEKPDRPISPTNREACHSFGTTLLKSIAKIGTQCTMKSGKKKDVA
jgi:hypothetical protein